VEWKALSLPEFQFTDTAITSVRPFIGQRKAGQTASQFIHCINSCVAVSLLAVCSLAALLPARRISRLDPAAVLHAE